MSVPCPQCGITRDMTIDHIIPSWFRQNVVYFGMSHPEICARAGLDIYLKRKVCHYCNLAKGGSMTYQNKLVRAYLKTFIEMVNEKINGALSRKLFVKCMCKECIPTPPETMKDVIAAHAGKPLTQSIEIPHAVLSSALFVSKQGYGQEV